jgi:hypothetical protein
MDAMANPKDFNPTECNIADLPDFPPTDETGNVDLSLIDAMLDCTPAQRIGRLEGALEFIEAARQWRIKQYGYDPAIDRSFEAPE